MGFDKEGLTRLIPSGRSLVIRLKDVAGFDDGIDSVYTDLRWSPALRH
jgi:hypothetical protein